MPCPGKIETLNLPGGPRVRVDTHVYQGYQISPYYDSMIAKVIVHRENRQETIKTMRRALDEFIIAPIKTTIAFHKSLLENPLFKKGDISTHFIENLRALKNPTLSDYSDYPEPGNSIQRDPAWREKQDYSD